MDNKFTAYSNIISKIDKIYCIIPTEVEYVHSSLDKIKEHIYADDDVEELLLVSKTLFKSLHSIIGDHPTSEWHYLVWMTLFSKSRHELDQIISSHGDNLKNYVELILSP